MAIKNWFSNIGPAALVTAAFIGPGTVTVCTLAGVNYGYSLIWALILSAVICIVLQEMSARLGLVSRKGLSEALGSISHNVIMRGAVLMAVFLAIAVGNAAYQAGNISGAVLGLETLTGEAAMTVAGFRINPLGLLIGVLAFALLYANSYKLLEKCLVSLVILMSIAFIVVAIATLPPISELAKGLVPRAQGVQLLTIVGLIGTTVVPYNLFLHAALVQEKWKSADDLPAARKDIYIAIGLGGIVSLAVIIAGAAVQQREISSAADLALGLEPVFGPMAKYLLSIGLFAAGITSAVTAPLAAAYVVRGCLGWEKNNRDWKFRATWMFILVMGVVLSGQGIRPVDLIRFAQFANGLLLPLIVAFLLWAMNSKALLGDRVNSWRQNLAGALSLVVVLVLGVRGVWLAIGI